MTSEYTGTILWRHRYTVMAIASALMLTACGGSDGKSNATPVAVIGEVDSVYELSEIQLDASASTDADGDELTYQWVQLSGADVSMAGADSATVSFTVPKVDVEETLTFQVEVSDGKKMSTATVDLLVMEKSYVVFYGEMEGDPGSVGLYLVSADGGERWRLLEQDIIDVSEPVHSRDRRYLAFKADVTDNFIADYSLYVVDIGAHTVSKVFSPVEVFGGTADDDDGRGDGAVYDVEWSPTANELAFTAGPNVGVGTMADLYVVDPDGSNLVNLTSLEPVENGSAGPEQSVGHDDIEWSPAGTMIAYGMEYADDTRNFMRLFVASVDGSGTLQEISDFDSQTEVANVPLYTRDQFGLNGDKDIAGTFDDETAGGSLLPDSDANLDGIADGSVSDWGWSPDGSQLYYVGDTGPLGVNELHVVDADGGNHVKLTHIGTTTEGGMVVTDTTRDGIADTDVATATWSPTGDRLAARAALGLDSRDLPLWRDWIIEADGSALYEVIPDDRNLDTVTDIGEYLWSPTGRYLPVTTSFMSGTFFARNLDIWDADTQKTVPLITSAIELFRPQLLTWLPEDKIMFWGRPPFEATEQPYIVDPAMPNVHERVIESYVGPHYWAAAVSPDKSRIAYAIDTETDDVGDFYSELAISSIAPASGVERPGSEVGKDVEWVQWTPDSSAMVYLYWDDNAGYAGLSSASDDGMNNHTDISGEQLEGHAGVWDFKVFGPPSM